MINRFLLISSLATFFCCQKEDFQNNLAETILGNWNIEKGGNFIFEKDSFSASLGCNTFFGEIKITDGTINFYLIASTKIGCTDQHRQLEEQFILLLENSTLIFSIDENLAKLYNSERELIFTLYRE
ncbi:MAG: META domain-containing protein [Bacteroidota bacterium]|nr:META domain-containing protein [Bacteroidota bacterium]